MGDAPARHRGTVDLDTPDRPLARLLRDGLVPPDQLVRAVAGASVRAAVELRIVTQFGQCVVVQHGLLGARGMVDTGVTGPYRNRSICAGDSLGGRSAPRW